MCNSVLSSILWTEDVKARWVGINAMLTCEVCGSIVVEVRLRWQRHMHCSSLQTVPREWALQGLASITNGSSIIAPS